jgi:hypothetical protein
MNPEYCDIDDKAEERESNELFMQHIKAGIKQLVLAYNVAENSGNNDTANGLATAIAICCQNAEFHGVFD